MKPDFSVFRMLILMILGYLLFWRSFISMMTFSCWSRVKVLHKGEISTYSGSDDFKPIWENPNHCVKTFFVKPFELLIALLVLLFISQKLSFELFWLRVVDILKLFLCLLFSHFPQLNLIVKKLFSSFVTFFEFFIHCFKPWKPLTKSFGQMSDVLAEFVIVILFLCVVIKAFNCFWMFCFRVFRTLGIHIVNRVCEGLVESTHLVH